MRRVQKYLVLSLFACVLAAPFAALANTALTARQVAEKFDEEFRHPSLSVRFKLSTCRYKLEQAQMRCSEKPRETVVENVLKAKGRDVRTVAMLSEPISDKGIGMLGWQYWDKSKVNDYWLYLPALSKVKRVVSVKDSKDSGSYFGSEFFIEDLEVRRLDDYTFNIIAEESVKILEGKDYVEHPAYVLEWTPLPGKIGTTNYGRMVTWVDKNSFVLLKGEYYDHDKALYKRRTIKNLEQVDGRWMPRQVTMDNLPDRRVTVMKRDAIAIGLDVDDEYFAQRTLTDEVFREKHMSRFRTQWKQ